MAAEVVGGDGTSSPRSRPSSHSRQEVHHPPPQGHDLHDLRVPRRSQRLVDLRADLGSSSVGEDPHSAVAEVEVAIEDPAMSPNAPEDYLISGNKRKFDDCTGRFGKLTIGEPGVARVSSRALKKVLARAMFSMIEFRRAVDPEGTSAANQIQPLSNCLEEPVSCSRAHQMLSDSIVQLAALTGIHELLSFVTFLL